MGEVTVYIDVLFMLNFLINSCLFYTTGKICKRDISAGRLCAVSAVSALYAAVMFFPRLHILYTLALKLIFSAVFTALAFRLKRPRDILLVTAVFFLVSFAFGGAAFAIMFLTSAGEHLDATVSNGQLYLNVSIWALIAAAGAAYAGITVFAKMCRKNYSRERLTVKLEIKTLGTVLRVNGFIDTGSYLCGADGTPALAIEYDAVRDKLPPQTEEFLADPIRAFSEYPRFASEHKLTVLSYRGFGGTGGVIPAVPADEVRFADGQSAGGKTLVAFLRGTLSDGGYNAIINPDIFDNLCDMPAKRHITLKNKSKEINNVKG